MSCHYDCITNLFKQEEGAIQNHDNPSGPAYLGGDVRKYKGLEVGGGRAYDSSSD
jgi:hypothetical protein